MALSVEMPRAALVRHSELTGEIIIIWHMEISPGRVKSHPNSVNFTGRVGSLISLNSGLDSPRNLLFWVPPQPPAFPPHGTTKINLLSLNKLILDSLPGASQPPASHGPEQPKSLCSASTNSFWIPCPGPPQPPAFPAPL